MRMNESNSTNEKSIPRTRAPRATRQAPGVQPGDDRIRQRAYEIYLRRDGAPGDPLEDWLCAERELIAEVPAPAVRANDRPRAAARKRS